MRILIMAALSACAAFSQIIAVDGTNTSGHAEGVGPTSLTFARTIGSGTNRALYVICGGLGSGTQPSSYTYNGTTMSVITTGANGGLVTSIFRMLNPPTGTANVVIGWAAFNQTYDRIDCAAIAFTGVDQTAPENTTFTDNSLQSTTLTATVRNTWLLGVALNHNGNLTASNGQTQLFYQNSGSWAVTAMAGFVGPSVRGSNTIGWTQDSGTATWGMAAIAIRPAQSQQGVDETIASAASIKTSFGTRPSLTISPAVTATQPFADNVGGDTIYTAWVPASIRSGSYGGGSILGSYNDGTGMGCTNQQICLFSMDTYDPTGVTPPTFTNINQMTSYGTIGTLCYDSTVGVHKSRAVFSVGSLLFMPIVCLNNSTWVPRQTGLIVSPDGGAHWCNYKTYLAHTGSPGCDSSNWQATGDAPVDINGYQWPLTTGNKMGEFSPIDMLCEGGDANCAVAQGVNPLYVYFHANTDAGGLYIHRVLKSLGMAIMDPANWESYVDGNWVANSPQSATTANAALPLTMCCSRISYLRNFGVFGIFRHESTSPMHFYYSPTPWGPWRAGNTMTVGNSGLQFPSLVGGLCPTYDTTTGKVTCTLYTNDTDSHGLYIHQINLGNITLPPVATNTLHWTSLTNTQWTSMTNTQWTTMGN